VERLSGGSKKGVYRVTLDDRSAVVVYVSRGEPVLIDIEGLMYFEAEWEHAFLRIRFGEHYRPLVRPGLDPDRLQFYQLALHLDLVAGPLRIADAGHPEREWFLGLAEHHLRQVLSFQVS
jgi:hypothetical protein